MSKVLGALAIRRALAVLILVLLAVSPSRAQATITPSAWEPWLGCWTLQTEQVHDGAAIDPTDVAPPGRGATRPSDVRVCVAPADTPHGVSLTTMVGSTPALSQTIVADGAQHPFNETGCEGWQRATWSSNGRRLFTSAALTCSAAAPRTVSQLAMLTRGGTWLDIQSVTTAGRESVRVRRYRAVTEDTGAPRAIAGSALTLDEIQEASAALSTRVVEAALLETNAGFDLNAKKLMALDDAGVADSVIDLMVALSYPDRFTVDRSSSSLGSYSGPLGWAGATDWMFGDPYLWGYYAPYAYSYWGYGNPWDQPGYGWVVVDPTPPDTPRPTGTGRVVDGLGYTRVRTREVAPAPRGGGAGAESSSDGGTSSGSSGGSSSGGGVSGQGYSSGGSSDSGRTAQPRPPGPGR